MLHLKNLASKVIQPYTAFSLAGSVMLAFENAYLANLAFLAGNILLIRHNLIVKDYPEAFFFGFCLVTSCFGVLHHFISF